MDTELLTLVAALIGSGAATSVVQWILGHAERDTPTKEGLRVLLFCKLEHIQAAMVANDGVCDVSTKETAETIYRAYSALGGNGVGSQMIETSARAHRQNGGMMDGITWIARRTTTRAATATRSRI